jgi:sortase (surface protein transpeptidase)
VACGSSAAAADLAVTEEITVRPAAAGAVLGLALAIGAPTAWSLTRPPTTAGAPVVESLQTPSAPSSPVPTTPTAPPPAVGTQVAAPPSRAAAPAPVRLAIPALGVDTAVDPEGVAPDGQMALPEDVSRVGWYRFGPTPGSDGSAVIAGHVDDREQGLGALAPLREAAVGTEIVVTDADGTTTRWRVVSRELITKQVLPLDQLFARSGPPRLTLITCGGPFLPEFRSYRDNVVVVAELVR